MYTIKVDTSQLRDAGEVMKVAGAELRRDLETDVLATAAYAQGIAREASPIFRGSLVNSIQVDDLVRIDGSDVAVLRSGISSSLPHTSVQEDGRRPNRPFPPIGAIRRWVELKVRRGQMSLRPLDDGTTANMRADAGPRRRRRGKRQTDASRIKGLAFVIARSIARKGIKGKRFMFRAGVAAQPYLEARVNATIEKWARR